MTTEETKDKLLELTDITQLGRIEKTKEILKGVVVTLQSLSATHQQKILESLPPQSTDALAKFTCMQIDTLVYSTVSINNKRYNDENRAELRVFYSNLQNKVMQEFYNLYSELITEQNSVIDSLKKT